MEPWILIGIAAAALLSLRSVLQNSLAADRTALEIAAIGAVIGAAVVLPVALPALTTISVTPGLAGGLLAVGLTSLAGNYCFIAALRRTDLSVASPARQTLPLMVAVLEPVLLATAFRPGIVMGAVLATVGGYLTLVEDRDLLLPFRRIGDRGLHLALGSAFFLALNAVAKRSVVSAVPVTVVVAAALVTMAVGFVGVHWWREGRPHAGLVDRRLLLLGLVTGVVQLLIVRTIAASSASQATIVFRLAVFSNVAVGGLWFGETGLWYRLVGSALIVAGVVVAV